jgi:hypothetical protein
MIVSTVGKSFCGNGPSSENACQAAATTAKGRFHAENQRPSHAEGKEERLEPGLLQAFLLKISLPERNDVGGSLHRAVNSQSNGQRPLGRSQRPSAKNQNQRY